MSHELYKKYRPDTLDKMVGNASLIASLKAMIENGKVPHACLFCGPPGTGKTTLARIVAKALHVADADLSELNSANFRGIDSMRDIIQQSAYRPSQGDVRVWILDEGHQVTTDAWNAALKLFEDTPRHCYFFICTTAPDKLPKAIQSRCSRFEVRALSVDEIGKNLLIPICKAEGIKPPMEVIKKIATDCMGSSRTALVTLERIASLSPEKMLEAAEQTMAAESAVNELCQALLKSQPWPKVAAVLKGIQEEPESVRRCVLGYMNAVLLNSGQPRAYEIMCCFEKDYFTSGKAGLTMSCFDATCGGK